MVEDHLKQTQRLYEVIVRSAFLYEVPVRSEVPCSASRSTTCTKCLYEGLNLDAKAHSSEERRDGCDPDGWAAAA